MDYRKAGRVKSGDLVKARNVNTPPRLGFIIKIEERQQNGIMFAFVCFPDRKDGYWYHLSHLEIISEII